MEFFLKGWFVGLVIAVPFGPTGVLLLRRTVSEGRVVGLFTALGIATADALYGLIAALGLTAVSQALTAHREPLRLVSALFLLYLGVRMIRARTPAPGSGAVVPQTGLKAAYFSGFALMIANPFVIVSFLAVIAAVGLAARGIGELRAAWLIAGLFLGSAAWWVAFSAATPYLRRRLKHGGMRAFNYSSGSVICAFGLWQLVELIVDWVRLR